VAKIVNENARDIRSPSAHPI